MAVTVSSIRNAVRIILDDPLKWNEVDEGIGGSGIALQRVYQLPTRPIVTASEVVTIDNVVKTRGVDYTVLSEAGQLFFATPPSGGTMHIYWQYSRWSDGALNQLITEATRYLSTFVPKLALTTHTIVQADLDAQGWTTSANDLWVYGVRIKDPDPPTGTGTGWRDTPYWHWDPANLFLTIEGSALVGDQFQVLSRQRWADPDTTGDLMDASWLIEMSDPVSWLVSANALESREADRDMAGLEGAIIDNQGNPSGAFVKNAAFWRKKFETWLNYYKGAEMVQRHPRRAFVL